MRCLFLFSLACSVATAAGWSSTSALPPPVPKEGPWVIPLSVYPMAEPKPALKYLLLPEVRDCNPGNQIRRSTSVASWNKTPFIRTRQQ